MKATSVLNGQVSELEHSTLEREFEADPANPFPLNAVLRQFYAEALFNENIDRSTTTTELAVLFSSTFDEPIRLQYVQQAEQNATERINNRETELAPETIRMQELVASYGRDYAFRTPTLRRQYDAVKWYTTAVVLYHTGNALFNAYTATHRHVKPLMNRMVSAARERIPFLNKTRNEPHSNNSASKQ